MIRIEEWNFAFDSWQVLSVDERKYFKLRAWEELGEWLRVTPNIPAYGGTRTPQKGKMLNV